MGRRAVHAASTSSDTLGRWQTGLADVGWNSLYWGNHDQPRAVSRFGSDAPEHRVASAKALATVLHLHRGTPYVYQGDELGMTNYPFATIEDFRDLESVNRYRTATARGDDPEDGAGRRCATRAATTPVRRCSGTRASRPASPPARRGWPVNPNHTEINAAAQVDDPDSVFTHHQRLIALRHEDPVVVHGDFTMLLPDHEQLYAFTRTLDDTAARRGQPVRRAGGRQRAPSGPAGWTPSGVLDSGPGDPAIGCCAPWAARVRRRTTE